MGRVREEGNREGRGNMKGGAKDPEREEQDYKWRDCNAECLNFIGKRNREKGSKVQKLKRFRVGGRGEKS